MPITQATLCTDVNWIDVINPTPQEMEDLSRQHGLNAHVVKDSLQPEHFPKYELLDDVHFLIIRYYAHSDKKQLVTIQELTNKVAIFYTESLLITIHKTEVPFLTLLRQKFVEPQQCTSATDLLLRIVWHALETFDDPANRLSEQIDFYESQVMMKKQDTDISKNLYLIKREASVGHKVVMLMLEPLNHIHIRPGEESALQNLRDQHLKIQTLYGQNFDDVNNLMNLSLSFHAQRTNEVMKVLTIFSVFFMPLTFIAGIYGMNFHYMPELQQKWGYPVVLLVMAIVAIFIYQWMKRKKWL